MNKNNSFDQLRLKLLEEVRQLDLTRPLPDSFTSDFSKLIEMAVFSLMHREDNFFGSCMIQMKRGIKFDLPSAAGVTADVSHFNMYFNPVILLPCSLEEIRGVIKHQIYHIMFRHLERVENLKDRFSPLVMNTGMDLAINQFIECLPPGEITLEEAEKKYGVKLNEDQPFEVYCEILQQTLDGSQEGEEDPPEPEKEEKENLGEDPKQEEDPSPQESRQEQDPLEEESPEEEPEADSRENVEDQSLDQSRDQSQDNLQDHEEVSQDFKDTSPEGDSREEYPGEPREHPREADSNLEQGESVGAGQTWDEEGRQDISSTIETAHREESCHDIWGQSNREENFENLKEMTRKMANQANRGQLPAELEEVVSQLNRRPEVRWQDILRKTVGTLPVPYKKTITRKDRRQPDRLDLRGRLSDRLINVIIALDTSASMGEEELQKGLAEIFSILRLYRHEVTIIECSSQIEKVYTARSPRDVQSKIKGRGGTAFSPVFEYINHKQLRNHLLIYFTDGYGEEELKVRPVNYRTLWVLTGAGNRLSLKKPHGTVKTLKAGDKP